MTRNVERFVITGPDVDGADRVVPPVVHRPRRTQSHPNRQNKTLNRIRQRYKTWSSVEKVETEVVVIPTIQIEKNSLRTQRERGPELIL